jgi:hypothetical protein
MGLEKYVIVAWMSRFVAVRELASEAIARKEGAVWELRDGQNADLAIVTYASSYEMCVAENSNHIIAIIVSSEVIDCLEPGTSRQSW